MNLYSACQDMNFRVEVNEIRKKNISDTTVA